MRPADFAALRAALLVVAMTVTMFISQKQLASKNVSEATKNSPMYRQQQMIIYIFPIIFLITGINFPIGVLIYWFTTNVWSMGQQFWVIRNNPQPGTPAFEAKAARERDKERSKALPTPTEVSDEESENDASARQQPKRTTRSQRKKK